MLNCCARGPRFKPQQKQKNVLVIHWIPPTSYIPMWTPADVLTSHCPSERLHVTFINFFWFYLQVVMDPVHGALSCKGCVKCIPGVTFSKFINYGPCRQCKNCTASGLRYTQPCTVERNAKCGEPLPPPPTKQQM